MKFTVHKNNGENDFLETPFKYVLSVSFLFIKLIKREQVSFSIYENHMFVRKQYKKNLYTTLLYIAISIYGYLWLLNFPNFLVIIEKNN